MGKGSAANGGLANASSGSVLITETSGNFCESLAFLNKS